MTQDWNYNDRKEPEAGCLTAHDEQALDRRSIDLRSTGEKGLEVI